ncbi:MAG TPA: Uma2 family endonuclease [Anaerolineae bacterium]|nr:Uma2 family endonuclease [Anaerolineae bacterium]
MVTAEKWMTAEDLLRLSSEGRYELVKGALIEMTPPGYEHGEIANRFSYRLTHHVIQNDLGVVLAAETGFRLSRDPDTVRAPDIAFVSKARRPTIPPTGYADFAPDLVVEVVSSNDDPDEIQSKVRDWLEAGVRVVLVVYPRSRQIAVYRSLREVTVLTEADSLVLSDVLPGFSCPVADVFAST